MSDSVNHPVIKSKLVIESLLENNVLSKEDKAKLTGSINFIVALQHRFPDERVENSEIIQVIETILNLGKEIAEK